MKEEKAPREIEDLRQFYNNIESLFSLKDLRGKIEHDFKELPVSAKKYVKPVKEFLIDHDKELAQLYFGMLFNIMDLYNIKIKRKKSRALSPKVFQETFKDLTGSFRHDQKNQTFFKYGLLGRTNTYRDKSEDKGEDKSETKGEDTSETKDEDKPETKEINKFINNIRAFYEEQICDFLQSL